MKLNKLIIAALLLGGLIMTSCTKDKGITATPATSKKLAKLYDAANFSQETNFGYDGQGRLISWASPYTKGAFNYSGNNFSATFKDQNDYQYVNFSDGKLDNKGRLTEMTGNSTPKNNPPQSAKYTYEYNADGFIIKITSTNVGTGNVSEYRYSYANGNLVKTESIYNGQPNYTTEYEYYDNLENKLDIDFMTNIVNWYTDGLTGKHSHNLIKTEKNYDAQNVLNVHNHFDYNLDTDGYPVSMNSTSILNNAMYYRTLVFDK